MYVSSFSLITALGLGNQKNAEGLVHNSSHFEDFCLENKTLKIAKINENSNEDHTLDFALKAIEDALNNTEPLNPKDDLLMIGCTKGMVETASKEFTLNKNYQEFTRNLSSNKINHLISQKWKTPFIPLPNAACATSGQALKKAEYILQKTENKRVILCMTEASLTKEFIGGFYKLGVLSGKKIGCTPFQADADGFTIGEGAAALVLQKERTPSSHFKIHKTMLANETNSFLEFSNGHHFILEKLIETCENSHIRLEDLGFIHLHGTSTQANDQMEISLCNEILKRNPKIKFAATKHLTGHLLGSSGLIELIISFLLSQSKTSLGLHPIFQQPPNPEKITQNEISSPYFANLSYGLGSTISIMLAENLEPTTR